MELALLALLDPNLIENYQRNLTQGDESFYAKRRKTHGIVADSITLEPPTNHKYFFCAAKKRIETAL
jgi:hypothetical protein